MTGEKKATLIKKIKSLSPKLGLELNDDFTFLY